MSQPIKALKPRPHDVLLCKQYLHLRDTGYTPGENELQGLGPHEKLMLALVEAYRTDGLSDLQTTWNTFIRQFPTLETAMAIVSSTEEEEQPKKRTLINFADLRNRPKPSWVIEGFIYENTIIELYAEAGCYKSFLAFDWAARIALEWETKWLGHINVLKHGLVVYIAAEGADGYISRGDAWCCHNKVPFSELAKNFFFWPEPLPLTNKAEIERFTEEVTTAIQETGQTPRLVVIDTLLRCSDGQNINAPDIMGAIFQGATYIKDVLGVPNVLIVHHAGKNAQLGGMGSVVLKNNCDCIYYMHKDTSTPGQVILKAEKMKDKPELQICLRSKKVYYTEWMDEEDSSLVLVEGDLPEKEEQKIPDSQQALLSILDTHKELTYSEWFELWHVEGVRGRSKPNFDKIKRKLEEEHVIEKHGDKYRRYITPKTEQESLVEE